MRHNIHGRVLTFLTISKLDSWCSFNSFYIVYIGIIERMVKAANFLERNDGEEES